MAVIDTNVIVHSRGEFNFGSIRLVPEVEEEIKSDHGKNILRNMEYQVIEPSDREKEKVIEKSQNINSPTSEADEQLLALSLERGETLITDDKALQNLALHLGVDVEGFQDPVLEEKFRWRKECDNCGKKLSTPPCPRCGSPQVRRKQVHCS